MSKTVIGLVSFGNFEFTRLTVDEIFRTANRQFDLALIVGKPGDQQTLDWAIDQRAKRGIHFSVHAENKGFAASINDLYDFAWGNHYDQLIIAGNDVVVYPGCIDGMIDLADQSDWDVVCASMFTPESLCARYPEARKYFRVPNFEFTDFSARPWELHTDFRTPGVEPNTMKDVRNMTLFKRSSFENIGYSDANFWPNAYFEDNDACRRAHLSGVKACGAPHCAFFHWVSRTIHQGDPRPHGTYFERNSWFYHQKWGGPVDGERFALPFNGQPYVMGDLTLPPTLKISHRTDEHKIVQHWRTR